MHKLDSKDAYKKNPAKQKDLNKKVKWQSKFYVKHDQILGASTSVANYYIQGNVKLSLALAECDIPRKNCITTTC
jgi:hypothetical protein